MVEISCALKRHIQYSTMSDAIDIVALEHEVTAIRANTVSSKSRNIYDASINRFLFWMLRQKPHLLTSEFIETVGDGLESINYNGLA